MSNVMKIKNIMNFLVIVCMLTLVTNVLRLGAGRYETSFFYPPKYFYEDTNVC